MPGNGSVSTSTSLIDYLIFLNVNELLDSMAEIEYFAHAIILPIVLSIGKWSLTFGLSIQPIIQDLSTNASTSPRF